MKTQNLVNTLLEIYYIINRDGFCSDKEAIKDTLLEFGVNEELISYHETNRRNTMNTQAINLEAFQVVLVGKDLSIYTNGSDELFVKLDGNNEPYRMCNRDGVLHIVARSVEVKPYGACHGLLVK